VGPPSILLTRVDFSFEWAGLVADDARFDWRGGLTFDVQVIDTGRGRVTFSAEYAAIVGRERRRYDLNQGTYVFEAAAGRRLPFGELAGVIAHVSRHLVDRENAPAVSWNLVGVRLSRRFTAGTSTVDAVIDVGRLMQQAFVDYVWASTAELTFRRPLTARTEILATGMGNVVGVSHAVRSERVCGGRLEGGVRLNGRAAAVEVFAAYERRVDAFPTDRFRVRFFALGFRLVNRR
jgi:hypothetical protein